MSVGPMVNIVASVAGSPLAQSHGSEVERARQDTAAQQRKVVNDQKAEDAAGVGQTDGEDHEAEERDADGRRLWEESPKPSEDKTNPSATPDFRPKDPTGEAGTLLDLSV